MANRKFTQDPYEMEDSNKIEEEDYPYQEGGGASGEFDHEQNGTAVNSMRLQMLLRESLKAGKHQSSSSSPAAATAGGAPHPRAASNNATNKDDQKEEKDDQKPGYTQKKCNCKQSQCIKLYCECYAAGVYCNDCHCIGCKNNDHSEGWRNRAIQNTLVKNPTAFLPKITQKVETSKVVDTVNLGKHSKGCACKRSGCMKKYCECFQAGVPCSENCKCSDCQNTGYASQGNLLRQFREEEGEYQPEQVTGVQPQQNSSILHKFMLAQNEDHLNTILGETDSDAVHGNGIPINTLFLEESCFKLLSILHLPDDVILKKRDELLFLEEQQKQEQDQAMVEENHSKVTGQEEGKINAGSEADNVKREVNGESNADTNGQKNKSPAQKNKSKGGETCGGEDSMECEEEAEELNSQQNANTRVAASLQGLVNAVGATEKALLVSPLSEIKGAVSSEVEAIAKRGSEQKSKQIAQTIVAGAAAGSAGQSGMDLEQHSNEVNMNQELFEIRRNFVLDTFLGLLRQIEAAI